MAFTRVRGPGITTEDNYRVGIITAAKFVGPIETTVDSDFTNINVTGISTVDGVKIGDPSGIITASSSSGIVTYYGDASKLTGLTAGQIPNLAASKITTGTVATARLGSGTANNTSFLRGDQTWASNTSTTINNNANNRVITGSGTADTLEGESGLTYNGSILNLTGDLAVSTANRIYFGNSDVAWVKGEHGGSGYLQFGVNTEHMRLLRSGNLGIGTNNPLSVLHVREDTFTDITIHSERTSGNIGGLNFRKGGVVSGIMTAQYFVDVSGNHYFHSQGSQRLKISSDGDLLITGSDNAELKLKCGTSTGNNIIAFLNSSGTTKGNIFYDSDNNFMVFKTNGTASSNERLRITSGGIVGFNNSSPGGACIDATHSRTNAYSGTQDLRSLAQVVARNASDAPDRFASISLVSGGGTQAEGSINLVQTANYTGDITFKSRTGATSWTEKLRIDSSGRTLINTTAVTNTNDALTVKRASGSFTEMSMTLDASTAVGSYCNAFVYTKSKGSYWNGYGFQSSHGYIGGLVGKRDVAGGDADQEIRIEIGGTNINQSEEKTWNFKNNGDLSISDGNLIVASGHGIDFSATGDSSVGANINERLDDYERGRFTPKIYYGTGTDEPTYSWRYGHYVKVGKQVTVWFNLGITGFNPNPDVNNVYLANLPFQNNDPNSQWKYLNLMFGYSWASGWGFGSSSSKQMFISIYDNETKARIVKDDGAHLSTADVGSGQRWSSTFSYQTDS